MKVMSACLSAVTTLHHQQTVSLQQQRRAGVLQTQELCCWAACLLQHHHAPSGFTPGAAAATTQSNAMPVEIAAMGCKESCARVEGSRLQRQVPGLQTAGAHTAMMPDISHLLTGPRTSSWAVMALFEFAARSLTPPAAGNWEQLARAF